MYRYDAAFFNLTSRNLTSAEAVVPLVRRLAPGVSSVADFGCAEGTWLSVWARETETDIQGLDGPYVEQERLLIDPARFEAVDLCRPIDLGRGFALVQSLEVAEHLPETAARQFVESLTRHASLVLFSAAPPGQGGENHVNEQPYEYWRTLFAERGYVPFDCIRPLVAGDDRVQPWYRYNILLYANQEGVARLSSEGRAARIADGAPIADVSPPLYRLRKALVRLLPFAVKQGLSRIKARLDRS